MVTGAGADIRVFPDLIKLKRVKRQIRWVNADFPEWMIESPGKEAARRGVSRQSVIKVWLAERLKQQKG
ncbi:MAG: CopG family transcriptional regulator [Chlorobiaceae bacterium]|nr:CopG family transcriptional regulator [Chlorobiaceae bacterium]